MTGLDPEQAPATHTSVCVHAFPSLHDVPSGFGAWTQAPVEGLQLPASAQAVSPQATGDPAQAPDWHTSPVVHKLPSLQADPFATGTVEQDPSAGLQTPVVQGPAPGQAFGFCPWHTPDWHVSVCVQAFPSLHPVPFASGA